MDATSMTFLADSFGVSVDTWAGLEGFFKLYHPDGHAGSLGTAPAQYQLHNIHHISI